MNQEIHSALALQTSCLQENDGDVCIAELTPAWQAALESLDEAGYLGLTELLAAYIERLENTASDPAKRLLEQWPGLFANFLASASSASMHALLDFLHDPTWEMPLAEEHSALLTEILEADRIALLAQQAPASAVDLADINSQADEDAFCSIDPALLDKAKIDVDAGLLPMLSHPLQELSGAWKNAAAVSSNELLAELTDKITPLARAAETVGLFGIKLVLDGLLRNVEFIAENSDVYAETPELPTLIARALDSLQAYFADIGNAQHHTALLDLFGDPEWPYCLSAEESAFLYLLLKNAGVRTAPAAVAEHAVADDVSLTVQQDTDPELLHMLLHELPLQANEFTRQLQQTIAGGDFTAMAGAQRAAHTLKGLANTAGIKGVANLTHRLEDILELLGDSQILPSPELTSCLSEAGDCLEEMAEAAAQQKSAPEGTQELLQRIMDWRYRLQTEGISIAAATLHGGVNAAPAVLHATTPAAPSTTLPATTHAESDESLVRIPKATLDHLLRIAGETRILNSQLRETAGQIKTALQARRDQLRTMQKLIASLEHRLHLQTVSNTAFSATHPGFDPLEMDRYNEAHSHLARLHELVADNREVDLQIDVQVRSIHELLAAQAGFHNENLEHVLNLRLAPAQSLLSRLQRIVRQACRSTGKEAELELQGGEALLDNQILEALTEPLLHILRNAVDHGLESPEQRDALGKNTQGRLLLNFERHGDTIRIACRDDGRGLDLEAIRNSAERKGLIETHAPLSAKDLQRLILMPGFSTRENATQLSGRGIGMDVVHQQILKLKGTLDIESTPGAGCCFHLTLPAATLTLRALLINTDGQTLALASYPIEQCVLSLDGELQQTPQGLRFNHAGESYPAVPMESLLHLAAVDYQVQRLFPVLLIDLGSGEKTALLISKITGHQELVLKSLGPYVGHLPGISGVTILATGQVAPVIDLPALIEHHALQGKASAEFVTYPAPRGLPKLLVVDDSLSARRSLATLLKDCGYDTTTAIDGLDALNQIHRQRPDLVLTDMEMPRMTGLELSAALRSRAESKHIPIIMITSRASEKHRREAELAGVDAYLTKPWSESRLLDQVANLLQETHH